MKQIKHFSFVFLLWSLTSLSFAQCVGKMINPITDICWSCLLPLSIGPVHVNSSGLADTTNPSGPLCACPRPPSPVPIPGIPIGFWEPVRLIDVTRTPYCMVSLGGIKLNEGRTQGTHGLNPDAKAGQESSFYHVHWYVYPVIYWLELLMDFLCLEKTEFDIAYLTELDPLWSDDEISFILNPEAVLFANPLAQVSCAADCVAASSGLPLDSLFWCGGCQGSLYPFTGTVPNHSGGVQASLLLSERMIAKLHRSLLLWGTSGKEGLCQKYVAPIIKKSQYKLQMTFPVSATNKTLGCHPLGRTSVFLESGREFPIKGEDFAYLLFRKRNCCIF